MTVKRFQALFDTDDNDMKFKFQLKWLRFLNNIQIGILFLLTTLFLPICQVLANAIRLNTNSGSSGSIALCVAATIALLIFGIGIPVLVIRLINRTVALILSTSRQYQENQRNLIELALQLSRTKAKSNGTNENSLSSLSLTELDHLTKQRSELEKQQSTLYHELVTRPQHGMPSSSLSNGYHHRWRFWRVLELVQKLLLVLAVTIVECIEPDGDPNKSVYVTSSIIGIGSIATIIVKPFFDTWCTVISILASVSNLLTVVVAVGQSEQQSWAVNTFGQAVLWLSNALAAVAVIVTAFLLIRALLRRRAEAASEMETSAVDQPDK